jgi:hypothetical protein
LYLTNYTSKLTPFFWVLLTSQAFVKERRV